MAYADTLRSTTFTGSDIASLIEGIFVSGFGLTWTAYTPTNAASGALTWNTTTTHKGSKYIQIGKLIFFYSDFQATTGGVASTDLTLTLPVAALNGTAVVCTACTLDVGGTIMAGTCRLTSLANIRKYDSSNFSAAAVVTRAMIAGVYEAA